MQKILRVVDVLWDQEIKNTHADSSIPRGWHTGNFKLHSFLMQRRQKARPHYVYAA